MLPEGTVIRVSILCGLLISLIVFFDLSTPLGISAGTLYVVAVVVSYWSPTAKFTYSVAIISSMLTIGAYLYKPQVAETWKSLFNRSIALLVIWVTAVLIIIIKQHEQKLMQMAKRDLLTGLFNRREMLNRFAVEHSRATRTGENLSVMMIDIDHFKRINDTYGHIGGDLVLKEVAHRLSERMRDYDLICRYGGEEFLVIAPETNVQHVHELAERLRVMISENPLVVDEDSTITMTISTGVTQLRGGESVEAMISRADTALYQAKELGRNRVVSM